MTFYRIEVTTDQESPKFNDSAERETFLATFPEKSNSFYYESDLNCYLFVSRWRHHEMALGCILREYADISKLARSYLKAIAVEPVSLKTEEITLSATKSLLCSAERGGYTEDGSKPLELFGIETLWHSHLLDFGERLLDKLPVSKESALHTARELIFEETLVPELERIYAGSAYKKAKGHPVHYFLFDDSNEVKASICKNLLHALYANGRIKNRRYCAVKFDPETGYSSEALDALYKTCQDGAMVVYYEQEREESGEQLRAGGEVIVDLCDAAVKYKNQALTVFCLPRECRKIKETFLENLRDMSFIELYEDIVSDDKAVEYLNRLAKKNHIRADKQLSKKVQNTSKGYRAAQLNRMFDEWYNNKLRTVVYPQYKDSVTVRAEVLKAKPKGKAIDELNDMIGLAQAKSVIERAVNYYKIQKLYGEKGIPVAHPSMHMVFTGNPGTAKTTVARLFAEIMRDNGVLSKGDLYEVGRSDLVGKYVGSTAKIVADKFRAARGSVLFIDEAYSLLDDREGLFGDEAINTIVQEMENNRENMVVIFAGYPDKMESFLQRNPGLRSRIAFHVPFEDYNADELVAIAELIARKNGMRFSEEARQKIAHIADMARMTSDFGNGRYMRNLVEQARMEQANRIAGMDFASITEETLSALTKADIPSPHFAKENVIRKLGFSASA